MAGRKEQSARASVARGRWLTRSDRLELRRLARKDASLGPLEALESVGLPLGTKDGLDLRAGEVLDDDRGARLIRRCGLGSRVRRVNDLALRSGRFCV